MVVVVIVGAVGLMIWANLAAWRLYQQIRAEVAALYDDDEVVG